MFGQIAERQMHWVRWLVTAGWLVLIGSLLFDPISAWLTLPENVWSPLRLDPAACVQVQGVCLEEQPYPLGTTIFWGAVVPSSIFILLIFGHELWRRICPLSFLSQIPRALGWQRQFKRVNEKTGKIRYELAKVKPDSWLGKNYLYLQFGLLYLGLCARLLLINSNRLALAVWFGVTIGAAIAVGYLYGGKTWCNYFCPMSPVQKIYSEPGGLLGGKAHIGDQQITQSMCRTVSDGKEQSACVACQNPCIDIDSERSYWDGIVKPQQKFLYYAYFGLVVGYFSYYYLYAGNWNYYFSGAWARTGNQWETLWSPGFYWAGQAIAIPKIIAAPLTLAVSTSVAYLLGQWIEKRYQSHVRRTKKPLSNEVIQHRIFTILTFVVFHVFFIFGGRPLILLMPLPLQFLYEGVLVGLSTLWFYHTWQRSPDRYSRESLASRLRRQLGKLQLNLAQFIEGRSLDDLSTDEVYVLAKVLPGFTQGKRHQAYKGVLREALEEGYVDTASSLEVLKQIRSELDISEDEHRQVLEELGVEDPELLDPSRKRSLENQVRLNGYRKALERMISLQQIQSQTVAPSSTGKKTLQDLLQNEPNALRALRREYSVTVQEEA
ncbi:MAG: cyclic nucleotide-binding protein, partial [Oculatellaceae cyanobacterium Prado106]|nr:cyclic nucleotide-binding protein [Oculatellaceae cyanobacterium Prado106]